LKINTKNELFISFSPMPCSLIQDRRIRTYEIRNF